MCICIISHCHTFFIISRLFCTPNTPYYCNRIPKYHNCVTKPSHNSNFQPYTSKFYHLWPTPQKINNNKEGRCSTMFWHTEFSLRVDPYVTHIWPIRVKAEAVKGTASQFLKYKYSHLLNTSSSFALHLLTDLHSLLHSRKKLEHQWIEYPA